MSDLLLKTSRQRQGGEQSAVADESPDTVDRRSGYTDGSSETVDEQSGELDGVDGRKP